MTIPLPGEYNPNFGKYIDLARTKGSAFSTLFQNNTEEVHHIFGSLPGEKHNYRYAENKWTIKEVLMHLIDTERVFGYRALVCGRGDTTTPLHYMDENLYAANVSVTHRPMESLLQEFSAVRMGNDFIFSNLTPQQSATLGNNVDYKISARAVAWAMLGHAIHHLDILHERYL
jgi:hypothetical protein